jgi:hypothetical protein
MQIMKMLLAGTMLAMMSVAALAEETPPVPPPQVVTCPYDLVPSIKEEVRQALGVIPAVYMERRQLLLTPKVARQKFEAKADTTIRGLPSTERRYA